MRTECTVYPVLSMFSKRMIELAIEMTSANPHQRSILLSMRTYIYSKLYAVLHTPRSSMYHLKLDYIGIIDRSCYELYKISVRIAQAWAGGEVQAWVIQNITFIA